MTAFPAGLQKYLLYPKQATASLPRIYSYMHAAVFFCHLPRLSYVNFYFRLLAAAVLLPFVKHISEILTRKYKVAYVDTSITVHMCMQVYVWQ